MASTTEIELGVLHPDTTAPSTTSRPESTAAASNGQPDTFNIEHEFSLPPVDRGKDAWSFLGAAFVVEILVWGYPGSFGLFQDYYTSHAPFEGSRNIAVIGALAMGLMYLSAPLVFGLMHTYPHTKRPCVLIGLIVMSLALGLGSLSQTVPQLIATQGIFYAIGGSLVYSPTVQFMDEWFVQRKGLAFGALCAGTGLGGVIIPFILQFLLDTYGFRTTLRVWAIVIFVATLPLIIFVKPRVPIAQAYAARSFNFSFTRTSTFLVLQTGNILQGLGFFVPNIYLPTYASQLGASSFLAAFTLILFNIASVFGCIVMGNLVDRLHVTTCIAISTIGSTLSVFLLWGFSTSLAQLLCFCTAYGIFAGSFSSTWPGIMIKLKREINETDGSMVFATLAAGRGIGNVMSGPLSEALIRAGEVGKEGLYGTEYGPLVVFTGVSALLGGVSVFGRRLGWV